MAFHTQNAKREGSGGRQHSSTLLCGISFFSEFCFLLCTHLTRGCPDWRGLPRFPGGRRLSAVVNAPPARRVPAPTRPAGQLSAASRKAQPEAGRRAPGQHTVWEGPWSPSRGIAHAADGPQMPDPGRGGGCCHRSPSEVGQLGQEPHASALRGGCRDPPSAALPWGAGLPVWRSRCGCSHRVCACSLPTGGHRRARPAGKAGSHPRAFPSVTAGRWEWGLPHRARPSCHSPFYFWNIRSGAKKHVPVTFSLGRA